jgi:RNA recognition motif-containing protein
MANDDAKLFVAGLPDSVSEGSLKSLFESTGGKVIDVRLPKEQETGRPRGFGFVTFSTPEEAKAAREALDGTIQSGRSISVRPCLAEPPKRDGSVRPGSSGPAPRRDQQSPDTTLYVGNLPYDCTQQEIEELTLRALGDKGVGGRVVRVHLPLDPDGRKRGFGFVSLSSAEAAKAAADALNGADMRGRRLVVNLAHPKGERPSAGPRSDFRGPDPRFGPPPGGPPPGRRTFDADKRRSKFEDGGGPRRPRGGRDEGRRRRDDWDYDPDE